MSEVEDPDEFKKHLKEEKTSHLLEKPLHGRFLKNKRKVITERKWQSLKGRHLKKETEAMVYTAQEQTLGVNLIKYHVDGQVVTPICRLGSKWSEMVVHLSSGCSVLGS